MMACCYCLVFFCTRLHLYKAALLLDWLAAILEGALDSRVIKLTKSQDNNVVSACSGNHRPSVSAFRNHTIKVLTCAHVLATCKMRQL